MQNLTHKLDAARVYLRLEPKVNHHIPAFVQERMAPRQRSPNSGRQGLNEAVKDEPPLVHGWRRRDISVSDLLEVVR